ncbi:MAG: hypothetical protein LBM13_06575 [Candidatus Ancillula sp.]|jgi:type I restriction enzyme R subunit|nr:hypothetical protein [Candidatus Ancillula sp.]
MQYNTVAESNESTVVAEFVPQYKKATEYQSEAQLEREFIKLLETQGYEYLSNVRNESDLLDNLKAQLERLNDYQFSDTEWSELLENYVCKGSDGIQEKLRRFRKISNTLLNVLMAPIRISS